jgi:hypothetical protein
MVQVTGGSIVAGPVGGGRRPCGAVGLTGTVLALPDPVGCRGTG